MQQADADQRAGHFFTESVVVMAVQCAIAICPEDLALVSVLCEVGGV
jgi:hypothetical protein